MNTAIRSLLCALLVLAPSLLVAAPTFTGVVNPASNIPPGLPNYGIAQGSIFVIYGAGLGPATLTQATSLPLPTTAGLAGTSVTVTVNGVTLPVPMLYTVQSQVAAILPSTTPVGTGTLALTYNGSTNSTAIKVVSTNFGISTVNQSGGGPAVVTRPDYSLVTGARSAKSGEVLVIWGTGLGPTAGSDAVVPNQTDLATPIQVLVGGIPANVLYRGRSAGPGLDQINITVPQGVVPGCFVSLVIQTGNLVSNSTSIPVSATGGQCSEPVNPNTILSGLSGKSSYKIGGFNLQSITASLVVNGQTFSQNAVGAVASFSLYPQALINAEAAAFPSLGSCRVLIASANSAATPPPDTVTPTSTPLNAGSALTLLPPSGAAVPMESFTPGLYSAPLSSIQGGPYQFSNGPGGPDVGAFSLRLNAPAPNFVWTNRVAASAIDRTKPLTLQWTGGDPAGFVFINLYAVSTSSVLTTSVLAQCHAPVAPGQFTIPASILLNFPLTQSDVGAGTANLTVIAYSPIQLLTVPGLDAAYGANVVGISETVGNWK